MIECRSIDWKCPALSERSCAVWMCVQCLQMCVKSECLCSVWMLMQASIKKNTSAHDRDNQLVSRNRGSVLNILWYMSSQLDASVGAIKPIFWRPAYLSKYVYTHYVQYPPPAPSPPLLEADTLVLCRCVGTLSVSSTRKTVCSQYTEQGRVWGPKTVLSREAGCQPWAYLGSVWVGGGGRWGYSTHHIQIQAKQENEGYDIDTQK
jgi:hypothetical protein